MIKNLHLQLCCRKLYIGNTNDNLREAATAATLMSENNFTVLKVGIAALYMRITNAIVQVRLGRQLKGDDKYEAATAATLLHHHRRESA